ncbi:D-alanyl-D-alanine carboxypeptidase family protein [Mechercharimyces sp. CAU 1602]|uniref:D-alanyl-D-alanine carboxypeptidase family protein n=1 Tax=Mechercharimyces sp. CAU 1602 TaxID=2973933 RepID=UPI0021629CE5|nr:D-alanyl-D-alanine carboxypeptidase family protein [Mechercharimyces sp. CAU 1602]MCS1350841.1 D-alanyl-D-alanine carboxypeptidase [Mechercharimyces sp. CAU 1602]
MRTRRILSLVLISLVLMGSLTPSHTVSATEKELADKAKSAILLDVDTGTVLYEKNADEKLPPASITKVMTMLLVMEALDEGHLSMEDKVQASEHAASMGGSQIFLKAGEEMKVEELLKAIAIASANDATVAVAEHLAGTEEAFVQKMNRKASELGMTHTKFRNTNGLPEPDHYTTARDISTMSRALLKHPEITRFTGVYEDYLRQESKTPFWLVNTNRLVKFYEGMDGLKTGFTQEAKYCLTATAEREGMRLIAVVMGEPDAKSRNQEIAQMMNFAFSQYRTHVLFDQGDVIGAREISKGENPQLHVKADRRMSILMKRGDKLEQFEVVTLWDPLKAPVKKGDTVGKVQVKKEGEVVADFILTSGDDIDRARWWTLFTRATKKILFLPDGVQDPEGEDKQEKKKEVKE